jgi:hypothetical protein
VYSERLRRNRSGRQGIAKTSTIAFPWTHSPVASKLGALHLKQLKPRASRFVSWNDAIVSYVLLMPCPPLRFSNAKHFQNAKIKQHKICKSLSTRFIDGRKEI